MFEIQATSIISKLLERKKQNNIDVVIVDFILFEINSMLESLNTRIVIFPNYPKIVIDAWDFDDELGLELLRLYKIYQKITNEWQ
ncbi:hypothetical protein [Streptococcus ruminantium]|nr:hypothetical protein [Streptococcus ruminantium]